MPTKTPPKIIEVDAGAAGRGRGKVRIPVTADDSAGDIERVFAAADEHGSAAHDTEHAVGDLQDVLRACWARMTPDARREVLAEREEWLEMWDPEQVR